jgi:hypothetical protein
MATDPTISDDDTMDPRDEHANDGIDCFSLP